MGPEPPLYVEVSAWDQYCSAHALRGVPCTNLVTSKVSSRSDFSAINGPPGRGDIIFVVQKLENSTNES